MAQSLEDLGALKGDAPVQPEAPVHVQKLDKYGRAYATGKRKNADHPEGAFVGEAPIIDAPAGLRMSYNFVTAQVPARLKLGAGI